jgi:fructan beta-fructosidase
MPLLLLISCSKSPATQAQNTTTTTTTTTTTDSLTPLSSYRPLYHYTPNSNWINDPNGLVYLNGAYHLFSQYNPQGAVWGNMSWDQATSNDFFSWQQGNVALNQILNADGSITLIFSGSAVIDSLNTTGFATQSGQTPLVAIYTANTTAANGTAISQNQFLSYSLDNGQTWQPYAKNPVLDIASTQFRDPKVFWYAPGKKWIMAVSKPDIDKVQFYSSTNLIKWTFMSDFGAIGNTSQVWECPDLYLLTVEGTNQKKWVLSVSGGGNTNGFGGMQYFIGNFDGTTFTADADNYPLYVDFGKDYYAGVTFNNIPSSDGRTVMIGWANNWAYAGAIPTAGYRGQYAVPRSLSLRKVNNTDGYHLLQTPVAEIAQHEVPAYSNSAIAINNTSMKLSSVAGTSLDIQFTLSMGSATVAGINVLKGGQEQTAVSFNKSSSQVILDRSKSGRGDFSNQFLSTESTKMDNVDMTNLTCRILVDQSIVEVFVNNGEYTLTDLVFPTQANGGIELFAQGGTANFSNLVIKQVNKTLH